MTKLTDHLMSHSTFAQYSAHANHFAFVGLFLDDKMFLKPVEKVNQTLRGW